MITTEVGRAAVEHARAIIGHIEILDRRMIELSSPQAGSVDIAAHVTGANTIVPMAVGHLLKRHPRMNVSISEAPPAALIERLERGTLDVLVGRMTDHQSTAQLELIPLYSESYRIVISVTEATFDVDTVELKDLVDHPWERSR